MEPKFVEEFFEELQENFIVLNRHNQRMIVKFNQSLEHSLITIEWVQLMEFYKIIGNIFILTTYIENNS